VAEYAREIWGLEKKEERTATSETRPGEGK
jgi:hypothetical protein